MTARQPGWVFGVWVHWLKGPFGTSLAGWASGREVSVGSFFSHLAAD